MPDLLYTFLLSVFILISHEDPVREGGDESRSVFKCVRFNTYPMKPNACGVSVEAASDVESLNPEMTPW